MTEPKIRLDQDGIRRALTRIAFEIVEKNKGAEHLLLAGVKTRGIYLAQRIAAKLGEVEGKAPPVLELDVTPWRDDVPRTDAPLPDLDPRIAGATVIICLLYTSVGNHANAGAYADKFNFRRRFRQRAEHVRQGHRAERRLADDAGRRNAGHSGSNGIVQCMTFRSFDAVRHRDVYKRQG